MAQKKKGMVIMKKKTALDPTLFTQVVSPPENAFRTMSVNIYEDGKFNMNGKLTRALGGKSLQIAFTDDCKNFMMSEAPEGDSSLHFPKNGSKKLPMVIQLLKKQKILFPARYEVWFTEGGFWQGDICENPTLLQSGKPRASKKS